MFAEYFLYIFCVFKSKFFDKWIIIAHLVLSLQIC